MKFKLDENFGPNVPRVFTERELDGETVHREGLTGSDDQTVLAAAIAEERVLVTMDHDFGNTLLYPPSSTHGIAIINPPPRVSRRFLESMLESFLIAYQGNQLKGKLWIVEPGRIREHQTEEDAS